MYWKARYAWRRVRLRLARLMARGPVAGLVRGLLPLYLALGLAVGGFIWARESPGEVAAVWSQAKSLSRRWVDRSASAAVAQLSSGLDAETAVGLLKSVLPEYSTGGTGPEPVDSWRTPMRAWVHRLTGYDFSEPRSFLEAAIPGFRAAALRAMDEVGAPAGSESAQQRVRPSPAQPPLVAALPTRGDAARDEGDETPASHPEDGPTSRPDHTASEPEAPERTGAVPARAGADAIPVELAAIPYIPWGADPLVLILHSHTSESYRTDPPNPQASDMNHIFNSSETGITRVGEALAAKLHNEYNIVTVHTKRIHNWPDHVAAYRNARETVEEFLRRYPSIQVVLDIHRQGVRDFSYATKVGGLDALYVDVIYTTAETMRYGSHPNWRENQSFATRVTDAMEAIHPGLLRRLIRVDDSRYNQDLHPHMILLEVGNYIDLEDLAINSAKLLADPIAKVLAEMVGAERAAANAVEGVATSGGGVHAPTRSVVPPAPRRPSPQSGRAG